MKRILVLLAFLCATTSAFASKIDDVVGCWKGANGATLYLTRDKQFVYTATDEKGQLITMTGKWNYRRYVGALHLRFSDSPMITLLVKEGDVPKAVSSASKIDVMYQGPGKCE